MIQELSHITFIVRDLQRMTEFLTHVFDAQEIYASGERFFSLSPEKFLLIGNLWVAIMEGEPLAEKTYNHIAFKIDDREFETYAKRIESLGVAVKRDRSRIAGEGRSLYFYDWDNHLFELHTGTLRERLDRYQQLAEASQPESGL